MAEEKKQKADFPTKTAIVAGALIILAGLGTWGVVTLINYAKKNDEFQQGLYEDYMSEIQEIEAFQRELHNKGTAPSEADTERLNLMMRPLPVKEKGMNTSTIERVIKEINNMFRGMGIAAIEIGVGVGLVVGGLLGGKLLYEWMKKRPPKTPTFKDPKTGAEYPAEQEGVWRQHMLSYESQYDPQTLNAAQAEFMAMPEWYRAEVMSVTGYHEIGNPAFEWGSFPGINWVYVAIAVVAVAATAGASSPALAGLLLL